MKITDAEYIHDLYNKYLYRKELLRSATETPKQFSTLSEQSAKTVKATILFDYQNQLEEVADKIAYFNTPLEKPR